MKIEQIYTGCLAEAAYYVESKGEVLIVDPLREMHPYLDRAKADNAEIKYIFLTHFHADFVSGQVDLARKTGATIVFGPSAKAEYEIHEATDGEEFSLGDITIKLLHTPGHTMESSTILLKDENGKDNCIFSGDTLFIGDVGRPDLAVKLGTLTEEDLAKHLFQSLRNKIMPLADDVIVYPNHGAGSACGKNMSSETFDTLGHQKEVNYALRDDMTQEEFVKEVLDGLTQPPQYFPMNVGMNKKVNKNVEDVVAAGTRALSAKEFELLVENGAMMLDVRTQAQFIKSHVPGSIFIGLNGTFAPWVGALIADVNQKIVLITAEGQEKEAVTRLSRIGFDNSLGYLKGGLEGWIAEGRDTDSIETITAEELESQLKDEDLNVLDVRKISEYQAEHIKDFENIPLDTINDNMAQIDPNKRYYIHCMSGFRSVIFESILKSRGIHNLVDVLGGFKALKADTSLEATNFVCPSTEV